MNDTTDTPKGRASGNSRHGTLPTWLDSRTVAIITTILTVAVALGTMIQTAHSGFRDDIDQLRHEFRSDMTGMRGEMAEVRGEMAEVRGEMTGLRGEMAKMRGELHREINRVRSELSADIKALDKRLRKVEIDVAAIRERLSAVEAEVAAIRIAMTGFNVRLKDVEAHAHDHDRES